MDILGCTVRRFCDSGCAFATAEYFYTAMVYCYGLRSFLGGIKNSTAVFGG